MKSAILSILVTAALLTFVRAQEHLVPESGSLAEYDEYYSNVTRLFAAAQSEEILCRVVTLGSIGPEQMVGVRKTDTTHEVISITPDSRIWHIELVRLYETGGINVYKKCQS